MPQDKQLRTLTPLERMACASFHPDPYQEHRSGNVATSEEKSTPNHKVLKLLLSISPRGRTRANCIHRYHLRALSKPRHKTGEESRPPPSLGACSASSSPEMPVKPRPPNGCPGPSKTPSSAEPAHGSQWLPLPPSLGRGRLQLQLWPEASPQGHDGWGREQRMCRMFRCPPCKRAPVTAAQIHG